MNPAALLKPFSAAFSFITGHPKIFAGLAAALVAGGILWFAYDWAYDRGYDEASTQANIRYIEQVRESMAMEMALKGALAKCEASIQDLRMVALEEQQWRDRVIRDLERDLDRAPEPVLTETEEYDAFNLLADVTRWRD